MTKLSPLPTPLWRSARGGPLFKTLFVSVEVVTPILGGSSEPRTIDDVDVIRAATVRGHLRFWWRDPYAWHYPTASDLDGRESEIRGRAASWQGGRSAVEIRTVIENKGAVDQTDIRLNDSRHGKASEQVEFERKLQTTLDDDAALEWWRAAKRPLAWWQPETAAEPTTGGGEKRAAAQSAAATAETQAGVWETPKEAGNRNFERIGPCEVADIELAKKQEMLVLKLKWATAHPIRSARDLVRFLTLQPLYSNR